MTMFLRCLTILPCLVWVAGGCGHSKVVPATQPVADNAFPAPVADTDVDAIVSPPAGWQADPLKKDDQHTHRTWLSPTGNTAYGVIHFSLPLPVPASWIMGPFLDNMKKSEGEANLIGPPVKDEQLPGMRFTVEGGDYKMRVNLITKGFRGWAVYAGTLRKKPEMPSELELAEKARERTGVPGAK